MLKNALNYIFRVGMRMLWKPLYFILFIDPFREWMLKLKATQTGKGLLLNRNLMYLLTRSTRNSILMIIFLNIKLC